MKVSNLDGTFKIVIKDNDIPFEVVSNILGVQNIEDYVLSGVKVKHVPVNRKIFYFRMGKEVYKVTCKNRS